MEVLMVAAVAAAVAAVAGKTSEGRLTVKPSTS